MPQWIVTLSIFGIIACLFILLCLLFVAAWGWLTEAHQEAVAERRRRRQLEREADPRFRDFYDLMGR